jgi:hypothetical protein
MKLKRNAESFIYPTDAQLDCSKNVKIYIKIYMKVSATCFGISQLSSGSYCTCFAKVINQLKYVVYRISSVQFSSNNAQLDCCKMLKFT